jgi:hypothetical protein
MPIGAAMPSPAFFTSRRYLLGAMAAGLMAGGTAAQAKDVVSWGDNSGALLTGSGKLATEKRALSGFQAVHLKGSMKVLIRQSGKEAVELRADDNLLPLIETAVVMLDGVPTLEIGTKKGASYTTHSRMVVTVDLADLKALVISGSGDVVADGVKTADLRLKITGSGDVRMNQLDAGNTAVNLSGSGDVALAGKSGKLSISIAGSGDVVTRDLAADDVSVSIAGSGDAQVNARKTLTVSIAGNGDVDYTGDPVVRTSIAGHGNVKKR